MAESAYEDREQTAVKHEILERYLKAFVPIVGDWASDIVYVDCLAGPWQSTDPERKDTSFGRAISVLRDARQTLKKRGKFPTMRCLFIEKDPEAFGKLEAYCDRISDIGVQARRWDFSQHIQEVVTFAKERSRSISFVFIDPTGWETLGVDLIKPILELNPGGDFDQFDDVIHHALFSSSRERLRSALSYALGETGGTKWGGKRGGGS